MSVQDGGDPAEDTVHEDDLEQDNQGQDDGQGDDLDGDEDDGDEGDDGAQNQADDDSEEIEHEGQKHRVPKALKSAFLRHQDYTRKTMELAEERRALTVERTKVTEASEKHLDNLASMYS